MVARADNLTTQRCGCDIGDVQHYSAPLRMIRDTHISQPTGIDGFGVKGEWAPKVEMPRATVSRKL